jgi:hypothetical protein
MRSTRRLSKIATKRQQRAQKAKPAVIEIVWDMSAVAQSAAIESGKPTSVRIGLSHHKPDHAAPLAGALEAPESPPAEMRVVLDDEIQTDQPAPRGRRRPPTPEEAEEALETLRERAKRGLYLGPLPPSEEEERAEQTRRVAERQHAQMLRATARPGPRPEAKNRTGVWGW